MCKFILNHELEAWRPVLHAIRELPEEYHWKWSELREMLLEEALGYLEHEFEASKDFSVVVPLQRMKYSHDQRSERTRVAYINFCGKTVLDIWVDMYLNPGKHNRRKEDPLMVIVLDSTFWGQDYLFDFMQYANAVADMFRMSVKYRIDNPYKTLKNKD
jgi:hypothetical protein